MSEAFDNSLAVSFPLFFIRGVISEIFFRLSTVIWLGAVIVSWVIDSNEQYASNRYILLILFLLHLILGIFLQYQSVKGRRRWSAASDTRKYKVYHYDIHHNTAEWVQT